MVNYKFYNMKDETVEKWTELYKEAIEKSYQWYKDVLDCKVSCARQTTDRPLQEIFELMKTESFVHHVFIDRKVIIPLDITPNGNKRYFETGVRVSDYKNGVDYFLFIFLEPEDGKKLIEKYKLF